MKDPNRQIHFRVFYKNVPSSLFGHEFVFQQSYFLYLWVTVDPKLIFPIICLIKFRNSCYSKKFLIEIWALFYHSQKAFNDPTSDC